MIKPIIHEIIVVEGRDDTTAIKRAVTADTIETNGSAINEATIEQIRHASVKRGVIIFTDPDFPGEKIRKTIDQAVPGCHHAFLKKADARPKNGRGIGVEHASVEAIQEALTHFHTSSKRMERQEITHEQLIELGLLGGAAAKKRRERLGELLQIGYMNGKQLENRLQMFGITNEKFSAAWKQVLQEEKDDERDRHTIKNERNS
ncbi:ribonuclease M5 [Listeria ilorinensis]|uniref:ribonuclease M5 n=1 Tax=Listeria ilorinensis TaxID=2867439 RepID=UPI001EF52E5F|nr:ribonuclease M5 [Listeria ilorinensis]